MTILWGWQYVCLMNYIRAPQLFLNELYLESCFTEYCHGLWWRSIRKGFFLLRTIHTRSVRKVSDNVLQLKIGLFLGNFAPSKYLPLETIFIQWLCHFWDSKKMLRWCLLRPKIPSMDFLVRETYKSWMMPCLTNNYWIRCNEWAWWSIQPPLLHKRGHFLFTVTLNLSKLAGSVLYSLPDLLKCIHAEQYLLGWIKHCLNAALPLVHFFWLVALQVSSNVKIELFPLDHSHRPMINHQ